MGSIDVLRQICVLHPIDALCIVSKVQVPNTDNSYLITGLIPGVTYVVQVHAIIKGIQSESDQIVATTGEQNKLFFIFQTGEVDGAWCSF